MAEQEKVDCPRCARPAAKITNGALQFQTRHGDATLVHAVGRSSGKTVEEVDAYFMDVALNKWPLDAGWQSHTVVLNEFTVHIETSFNKGVQTIECAIRQVYPPTDDWSDVITIETNM